MVVVDTHSRPFVFVWTMRHGGAFHASVRQTTMWLVETLDGQTKRFEKPGKDVPLKISKMTLKKVLASVS